MDLSTIMSETHINMMNVCVFLMCHSFVLFCHSCAYAKSALFNLTIITKREINQGIKQLTKHSNGVIFSAHRGMR